MENINVLSLFSGIGAFEKALDRKGIGYNLVNYCELDKYASKSYSAVHGVSEMLNLGDITKVNIAELEPHSADLITYGFPCQDISNAGKQRGFEHDGQLTRSGLFFYAAAIIGRIQPKVAICENVKALTGKKFTKEFETVLQTLEDMGYKNYWQVLNAKDYGIPQNRERVFIVSIRNDIDKKYTFPTPIKLELRLKDILEKEVDEKYYLSQRAIDGIKMSGFSQKKNQIQTGDVCGTLLSRDYKDPKCVQVAQLYGTDCNQAVVEPFIVASRGRNPENPSDRTAGSPTEQRLESKTDGCTNTLTTVQKDNYVVGPELRIRKLTPLECWRLMGFDDEDFYKAEKVNSNTQLYKQAGNSIVVNVLEAIFNNLKGILYN